MIAEFNYFRLKNKTWRFWSGRVNSNQRGTDRQSLHQRLFQEHEVPRPLFQILAVTEAKPETNCQGQPEIFIATM